MGWWGVFWNGFLIKQTSIAHPLFLGPSDASSTHNQILVLLLKLWINQLQRASHRHNRRPLILFFFTNQQSSLHAEGKAKVTSTRQHKKVNIVREIRERVTIYTFSNLQARDRFSSRKQISSFYTT